MTRTRCRAGHPSAVAALPILSGFLVAGLAAAPAAAQPVPDLDSLAAFVVEEGSPGAAVLLVQNGEIILGVAGVRRAGTEDPIRPGDRWHLGSNSKAMTAVLVARLVERGVVSWEDSVGRHLAGAVESIRPEYVGITWTELLRHTSGLPANAPALTMFALQGHDRDRDSRADRVEFSRQVLSAEPAAERGKFLYSNAGYTVVGAMLEAATGESWEVLMRRHVFEPLGLGSAGFGPPGRGEGHDPASEPAGHRPTGPGGGLVPVPDIVLADNPPALGPAGRVHMSMEDYGRFLTAVLAGARGEEDGFLGPDSWDRLLRPEEGHDYALGWGVSPETGALGHSGSNTMWFIQALLWPDQSRGAAVAVNEGRLEHVRGPVGSALRSLRPTSSGSRP